MDFDVVRQQFCCCTRWDLSLHNRLSHCLQHHYPILEYGFRVQLLYFQCKPVLTKRQHTCYDLVPITYVRTHMVFLDLGVVCASTGFCAQLGNEPETEDRSLSLISLIYLWLFFTHPSLHFSHSVLLCLSNNQ